MVPVDDFRGTRPPQHLCGLSALQALNAAQFYRGKIRHPAGQLPLVRIHDGHVSLGVKAAQNTHDPGRQKAAAPLHQGGGGAIIHNDLPIRVAQRKSDAQFIE